MGGSMVVQWWVNGGSMGVNGGSMVGQWRVNGGATGDQWVLNGEGVDGGVNGRSMGGQWGVVNDGSMGVGNGTTRSWKKNIRWQWGLAIEPHMCACLICSM